MTHFFAPPGTFAPDADITVVSSEPIDRTDAAAKFMVSDETLMLDCQHGSQKAFEQLFERYREPLYAFFRRRLDNSARAEDLTQETFLAVVRATSRYERGPEEFSMP